MEQNKETCPHELFYANTKVCRRTASETDNTVIGYSADLTINCTQCGQAFEFIGVPLGYSPFQPMANFDGTKLRIPIRPSTLEPIPLDEEQKKKVN